KDFNSILNAFSPPFHCTTTSIPDAQFKCKDITSETAVKVGVDTTTVTAPVGWEFHQIVTKRVGMDANTKAGFNTTVLPSAGTTTGTTQHENDGCDARMDMNDNPKSPTSYATTASSDSAALVQTRKKPFGLDVEKSQLKYDQAHPQERSEDFNTDASMALNIETTTYMTDLPAVLTLTSTLLLPDTRRIGADFNIQFGFSSTVSTPASLSTPAQLKTKRVGVDFGLKLGFTAITRYFVPKPSASLLSDDDLEDWFMRR
ncbi:hypothetical protein MAM1_0617c11027, partial [Mucor ambiguus]